MRRRSASLISLSASSARLRSVMSADDYAHRLATAVRDHARADLDVHQRAILPAMTPLAAYIAPLLQHALNVTVHVFAGIGNDVVERKPHDLFGSVTEEVLVRAIGFQNTLGVDVYQEDALGGLLDHCPVELLALPKTSLSLLQLREDCLQPLRALRYTLLEAFVEPPYFFFRPLAFGDVSGGDYHASHSRVVEQVVYDVLEVAPRAVLVRHPELQGQVKPGSFQGLGEYAQRSPRVVRMDLVECVGPYLLFRLVAHHPLDCRANVADGAVGLENCDDIGGVLYQRAKALLALFDSILELLALGDVPDHTREQPFSILVSFAEGHLDRELAAVFAQRYELRRAAHHARFARSKVTVQSGHAKFSVSFGHKQRDRLPDDLFCPVAEDAFRPTIEPPDYPVRCYGHNRVEGRVQNGAVACLAFS